MFSKESIEILRRSIKERRVLQGPLDLQIIPTTRCNAECIFCPTNAVSLSGKERYARRWLEKGTDINFGILDRLIDDLFRLKGLKRIHITGGEPLLYKRIMAMIFLFRRNFPQAEIALVTNGILLEDFSSGLARSGLDRISVSVNAGTGHSFSAQSRVSGDKLEGIKKGVRLIRDFREKNSGRKPYLSLTFVLNRHNYKEVDEALKFGVEAKADAVSYIPLMDFAFPGEDSREYALNDFEFEEFFKEIERLKPVADERGIYLGFTGNAIYKGKLRAGDIYKKVRCYSGYSFAMVWPDGDVRACCNCEETAGNLHNESFYQIWTSERFQGIRERMFGIVEKGPPELCDCEECGYLYENLEFHRLIEGNE